jgi:hypothetical protein
MVARIGFSATTSRKFRQARKGATVAAMSGAGGKAGAGRLLGLCSLEKIAVLAIYSDIGCVAGGKKRGFCRLSWRVATPGPDFDWV